MLDTASRFGATPKIPKNGSTDTRTPGAGSHVLRSRPMGTKRSFGSSHRSGSPPQSLRIAFHPIGSDGSIDNSSTSSASPGRRAPRLAP
jgi:hypothetical protein